MKLILSTRGSPLALWQAHRTQALLAEAVHEAEVQTVQSSGDLDRTTDLARFGRIGIFTVEVDRVVLADRAHVGVHSLKDMTTELHEGMRLAGVLARGPVEDALVSREGLALADLPEGARVATGSLRRRAMLLAERPDLEIVGIRGNVDTRLAKLEAGEADALLMARAGLVRLGHGDRITEVIDRSRFVPAVGQGIVGLTCREDDGPTRDVLESITDRDAWDAALSERSFLRHVHGGCNAPVGGHATIDRDELSLVARVLSCDGTEVVAGSRRGTRDDAEEIGRELALELLRQGASELLEAARE